MSHFMPGNAETIIDYDCVPTYSQTLAAQIINMNDNVIVSQTSLKSGTIPQNIFYSYWLNWYWRRKISLKTFNLKKKIIIPWKNTQTVISIFSKTKHWPTIKLKLWKQGVNKIFCVWRMAWKVGPMVNESWNAPSWKRCSSFILLAQKLIFETRWK